MSQFQSCRKVFRIICLALLLASQAGSVYAGVNAWSSDGPTNGTIVTHLVIDSQTSTVYASTNNLGVFKSVGSGVWTAINAGLPAQEVNTLVVDSQTPATLYAAPAWYGVYKSTNGGSSWDAANQNIGSTNVGTLAIDPSAPDTLYAGAQSGLYRSTNGGSTWSQVYNDGQIFGEVELVAIDPHNSNRVYVSAINAVYLSTDKGQTWNPIPDLNYMQVHALAFDPQDANNVYAGTGFGFYKSTNGGNSWKAPGSALSLSWITAVVVDSQTPTTLYAGAPSLGVYQSKDSGENWSPMNDGLGNTNVLALAMPAQNPVTIYAGTEGGVYSITFLPQHVYLPAVQR